jgi:signal transduction histidine kinase
VSLRASQRLAWSICGASFALIAGGFLLLILNRSTVHASSWFLIIFYAPALTFSTLGALIAARRPKNPIGWMLASFGLITALQYFTAEYAIRGFVTAPGSLPAATLMAWLNNWIFYPNIWIVIPLFFLLFPGGRVPSRRWIPLVWLVIALASLQGLVVILTPGTIVGTNEGQSHLYNLVRNPTGVDQLAPLINSWKGLLRVLLLGAAIACFVAFVRRFFGARGDERQQLKWLASMGAVSIVANVLGLFIQSGLGSALLYLFGIVGLAIGLPGAATLAILKYRLYDIDVVINRTLVYGTLAAFITSVYVAIVVGVGTLLNGGSRPNLALSVIATAVVAVAFQPVRIRIQALANRLVYGYRVTPYEALTEFSHRVAGAYANEDVLPRLARVLAEGTGAVTASVWIHGAGEPIAAASWPANESPLSVSLADRSIEVRHQGETLGELTVKKRQGEPMTPVEGKLMTDLAAQAGQVLRNVRLTSELQARLNEISAQAVELRASRQRIVAVQDAERRRLEQNIHDGAQQHLVALTVRLRLAATLAGQDPTKAHAALRGLEVQAANGLQTLRDLAQGIYPSALRQGGLIEALQVHAPVVATGVGRYDPEVEAGVYFCCLEALQNATKHAKAMQVRIKLEHQNGHLTFMVVDDGAGFDPQKTSTGAGLQNMQDRVASLGGQVSLESQPGKGTTVSGWFPVGARSAVTP